MNLFVSFSGQDQSDVRRLLASFQLQGLSLWDYSRPSQALPPGGRLYEGLARRIDDCDYFLAVVSANTVDELVGRDTRFEVQHALDRGLAEAGRLLPILFINKRPGEWAGPYRKLQALVRVEVDSRSPDSIEEGVRRVCGRLSVAYSPPLLNDPRVFFSRRFTREVGESGAAPLTNDQFLELTQTIIRCAERILEEDWATAHEEITLFMLYSNRKIPRPEHRFYYPQIIKGVCELQLGEYAEAERTFRAAAGHPRRDELSFAGLGHTYYGQRRYQEALAEFQKALSVNPVDKDIEFNILGTLIEMGGGPDGGGAILQHYDDLELSPADRFKVNKVKGIFLHKQGRYREAARVFGAIGPEEFDDACADYYASALEECGRVDEAIAVLRAVAARLDDTNLYHILARAYLRADDFDACRRVYEDKLCHPSRRTRKYLIEFARILRACGGFRDRRKVRELCETVLDPDCFGGAEISNEDFFYMGFGNYLLGRHERARYDFELSRGFCDKYYDDDAYRL